ncbi:hypothetical protein ACZ91_14630 [Streptomyces regensis]|nr:hypothetical protein ACZ91_14630 [Streptomyces regensis]
MLVRPRPPARSAFTPLNPERRGRSRRAPSGARTGAGVTSEAPHDAGADTVLEGPDAVRGRW